MEMIDRAAIECIHIVLRGGRSDGFDVSSGDGHIFRQIFEPAKLRFFSPT